MWVRLHAGEVPIPEVMFPGGSPHLVEPIYQNPTLSAPFNEQLSSVIIARCAEPTWSYTEDRFN